MAFQMGFPKKLNVPQRKIQNKYFGDINLNPKKGRMEIDNISVSSKADVGNIGNMRRVGGIKGSSADIGCCGK